MKLDFGVIRNSKFEREKQLPPIETCKSFSFLLYFKNIEFEYKVFKISLVKYLCNFQNASVNNKMKDQTEQLISLCQNKDQRHVSKYSILVDGSTFCVRLWEIIKYQEGVSKFDRNWLFINLIVRSSVFLDFGVGFSNTFYQTPSRSAKGWKIHYRRHWHLPFLHHNQSDLQRDMPRHKSSGIVGIFIAISLDSVCPINTKTGLNKGR